MESPLTTRAVLLFALSAGESYGLEILSRVSQQTSGGVVLLQGSLYPALQSLLEEGLVEEISRPVSPRQGRPRRYYRLTSAGELRVAAWRTVLSGLLGAPT